MMPTSITSNAMTGPFTGQHTADFVRSATIYLRGGCFVDVGTLLMRHPDWICWDKLTEAGSPYGLAIPSITKENRKSVRCVLQK
ncbi:uncharacterized protein CC84DRAFT_1236763 [Paraphaeosphaeria sporulosa]|uniref:Uncharacterized protein n=1 Tax=Paraphaeosphaeria sporulosa TaxID=1460663 RepID=A0A177CTM2_9PLEO|nr:uncharacterized protein CC84DRAFT_1236763 [Paraphaeosphaeria sporulosa]OAG10262.1 hypothetical protein CC84DRAFT_1236763 [Paraphaeosphaeria sporulosa]